MKRETFCTSSTVKLVIGLDCYSRLVWSLEVDLTGILAKCLDYIFLLSYSNGMVRKDNIEKNIIRIDRFLEMFRKMHSFIFGLKWSEEIHIFECFYVLMSGSYHTVSSILASFEVVREIESPDSRTLLFFLSWNVGIRLSKDKYSFKKICLKGKDNSSAFTFISSRR